LVLKTDQVDVFQARAFLFDPGHEVLGEK